MWYVPAALSSVKQFFELLSFGRVSAIKDFRVATDGTYGMVKQDEYVARRTDACAASW
jgi:hypothetical protein